MAKKKQAKEFNYAVGHYWEGESGSVGCYAYGNDIFYGSMAQAKGFLEYVQSQEKASQKQNVEIGESFN